MIKKILEWMFCGIKLKFFKIMRDKCGCLLYDRNMKVGYCTHF